MEGRQPEGIDAETAAWFPDRLVESELGLIPEGWQIGCLGDIAANHRESVDPSAAEPNTPYIGLEHMPRGSIALSEWGWVSDIESQKSRFRQGDFLFGKLRPYFHKVGVAAFDGVCSTDILVVVPTARDWYGLVLFHISSAEFINYATLTSTGTRMPRASWQDMAKYPLIMTPQPITQAYNEYIFPVLERIQTNIAESHTLASTRDTLLPKLMSGEVRAINHEANIERNLL
jgi:type I restriction enzyme, S subunit